MIESADGSRTNTGPHLLAPGRQAHPARRRRDTARARRTPAAPAAVSVTVCSSLTAQHRRSRNGTN